MSVMTRGIIAQPYSLAMDSDYSRRQFYSHAQVLLAENERLATENSEIGSAAITYIEDMQEAQHENERLTELFKVGMTLDGNLRVYGDWQSVRKAQEILTERDQLKAETYVLREENDNLRACRSSVNAAVAIENEALRKDAEQWRALVGRAASPVLGYTGCVICGVYTDHGGLACPKTRATADAAMGKGEQS